MDSGERFIALIQQNERIIYKVAGFYTDSRDDRDDLVQEIIYELWKSFDTYKKLAAVSTWIYRVAMNVAIFHLKKQKRKLPTISITPAALDVPANGPDDFDENLTKIRKHIEDLSFLEKGILMLYLEDKSHEEIGNITGISKSNVGTKLSRIREKLRQKISDKK